MLKVNQTPIMQRLQNSLVTILLILCMLRSNAAEAQSGGSKSGRPRRSLVLEVLIQPSPIYRVRAQEWGRELQELGYAPRFREPVAGEKMRVEQQLKDGRDVVFIVGGMTKEGGLTLGNRTFAVADMKQLSRFLDDIRTYGPGGAPAGNPRWGLTEEQFQDFVKLVAEPIEGDVSLGSAAAAVGSLKLPETITVIFAEEAFQASLQPRPETAPETLTLNGLTKGTALSVVLAQYGMGYRPILGRADRYTVEIVMGDESSNLWPTGWKTAEATADVLPAWLKSIPFDVEDADVASVIEAVADKLEIPLVVSSHSIQRDGQSLDDLLYSRSGKLSPFGILRGLSDKFELGFDVRADEAGKLFLWATSSRDAAAFNKRFAHIRPPK